VLRFRLMVKRNVCPPSVQQFAATHRGLDRKLYEVVDVSIATLRSGCLQATPLIPMQPPLPRGSALWTCHVGEGVIDERHIPTASRYREGMTQNVQFAVQCAWLHALETLGAVRAHHACRDIAERHLGQRVAQERIEGQRLAVGPALTWNHLVAIAAHDVGHRNVLERLVNLRSPLVGFKFLFACPYKCFALGVERTSDRRPAFTPNLSLPPMTSLSYRRQSAIPLCQKCASGVV